MELKNRDKKAKARRGEIYAREDRFKSGIGGVNKYLFSGNLSFFGKAFFSKERFILVISLFAAFSLFAIAIPSMQANTPPNPVWIDENDNGHFDAGKWNGTSIQTAINQLPLSFIANAGQTDLPVRFHVKGAGHTMFFTSSEVVFSATQHMEDDSVTSAVRLGSFLRNFLYQNKGGITL
jgi:hypothetical protein